MLHGIYTALTGADLGTLSAHYSGDGTMTGRLLGQLRTAAGYLSELGSVALPVFVPPAAVLAASCMVLSVLHGDDQDYEMVGVEALKNGM